MYTYMYTYSYKYAYMYLYTYMYIHNQSCLGRVLSVVSSGLLVAISRSDPLGRLGFGS